MLYAPFCAYDIHFVYDMRQSRMIYLFHKYVKYVGCCCLFASLYKNSAIGAYATRNIFRKENISFKKTVSSCLCRDDDTVFYCFICLSSAEVGCNGFVVAGVYVIDVRT